MAAVTICWQYWKLHRMPILLVGDFLAFYVPVAAHCSIQGEI